MSSNTEPTRTRILNATCALLEAGNRKAVRMSDIAKAAGISRQALYLHFPSRAELLIETTRYYDEINGVDALFADSRNAIGVARLDNFVAAWWGYIPSIYGVASAIISMRDTDTEAAAAWDDRMAAVRHGCAAAVAALETEGTLTPSLNAGQATDVLWTLLSIRNWEHLTRDCGWPNDDAIAQMQRIARAALVA